MQRGMRAYRVWPLNHSEQLSAARDIEARDADGARAEAALALQNGQVGQVMELPLDSIRQYEVTVMPVHLRDKKLRDVLTIATKVRAKSSREAIKMVQVDVERGGLPDMMEVVDAEPLA